MCFFPFVMLHMYYIPICTQLPKFCNVHVHASSGIVYGSDQLESLSYFGHCAHSAFYYSCNLVCLCLFLLMYFNEVILL